MKITRKVLSLVLCASFIIGAITVPVSAAGIGDFTDIDGHWAQDGIEEMVERGIMTGTSDTDFSPDSNLSRAMFVTMLGRYHESLFGQLEEQDDGFTDTASGSWYSAYVCWAADVGIISGYGDGRFGPDDSLTREQSANLLYNYVRYLHFDTAISQADPLAGYTDRESVSTWASDAMVWAVGNGMVSGVTATTLSPDSGMTRAQAAVLLHRFITTYVLSETWFTEDTMLISNATYGVTITEQYPYYLYLYKNNGTEDIRFSIQYAGAPEPFLTGTIEPGQTRAITGVFNEEWAFNGNIMIGAQFRRSPDSGHPTPGTLMILASNMPFSD